MFDYPSDGLFFKLRDFRIMIIAGLGLFTLASCQLTPLLKPQKDAHYATFFNQTFETPKDENELKFQRQLAQRIYCCVRQDIHIEANVTIGEQGLAFGRDNVNSHWLATAMVNYKIIDIATDKTILAGTLQNQQIYSYEQSSHKAIARRQRAHQKLIQFLANELANQILQNTKLKPYSKKTTDSATIAKPQTAKKQNAT